MKAEFPVSEEEWLRRAKLALACNHSLHVGTLAWIVDELCKAEAKRATKQPEGG